jgi:flagellar protein FliO/FliZ
MMRVFLTALLFALTSNAFATQPAVISPSGSLLQILFGLFVVLGLMGLAAWLFKRVGPTGLGNKIPMKIIAGLNVGNRERILVVEVADQWLVVGISPHQINTLATLEKQEHLLVTTEHAGQLPPFASWLAKAINKNKPADSA